MNKSKFLELDNKKIPVRELMITDGVYIDTNGNSNYSSKEEIAAWKRAVETRGLAWVLPRFFQRKQFTKVN